MDKLEGKMIMIRISTRLVFVLPKVVVKIPIDRRGYLQGKNESYLYKKYKTTNLLGELLCEFFGIVVMKRYKLATSISEDDVAKIKRVIPELNIDNCDLNNPKNWGQGILIDYGITEEISRLY